MLNAVAIANRASGAGSKLRHVDLPFRHVFDPAAIDWQQCLDAELIVMFGGDGTLQHTTTELIGYLADHPDIDAAEVPPLAVVPFGTTNMSARTINHSKTRKRALERLAYLLSQDAGARLATSHHRLLQVGNGTQKHFGYAFGLGAISELVDEWRRDRSDAAALNRMRSMLTLLRGFTSSERDTPVSLNGRRYHLYVLVLTTLSELLYGFKPFWNSAREPDATMRCTWIETGTRDLLARAPALLRGAPRMAGMDGFGSTAFHELRLELDNAFVLDGEIYHPETGVLEITTHNALRWVSL